MKEYRDYDEEGNDLGIGCSLMMVVIVIAIGIGIMFSLSSCTTTKDMPKEIVRTEYVEADTTAIYERAKRYFESLYKKSTQKDTVIDRTNERVVLTADGDTARYDRERIIYRSTNRETELKHKVSEQDSIINALKQQLSVAKTDTIREPYPVERELTRWEQAKMDLGGIAMGVIVAILAVAVWWVVRAKK